jgi:hypothetical protein
MSARALCPLLLLVLCVGTTPSYAHKPSDSYLMLSEPSGGAVIQGQWDIALRDLEHAVGLDLNQDGAITWGELKARQAAVFQYALSRLSLEAVARGERGACLLRARQLLFDEHVDGGYAVLRFDADCPLRPAQLAVHYTLLFDLDPNHRGLLSVRTGGISQATVLSSSTPTTSLSLGAPRLGQQFAAFVAEGVWHIFKGFDHILFLLTLLLPAVVVYANGRWHAQPSLHAAFVDVLKVVTAFTLAHSLTLSLAVNGWVRLPSRLVESAIALTVVLGALNNLYPLVTRRRWAVAFTFGLIHGLGFASVLADLGLKGLNLAVALVGFNAGVELGQLAIVLTLVPIAFVLRDTPLYRRAVMPAGAAAIGAIAVYWFAIRAFGISLQ